MKPKRYNLRAFQSVLSHYSEAKTNESRDSDSMGMSHGIVKTSRSDFLCDVELATRRVINNELGGTPNLKTFFSDFFLKIKTPAQSAEMLRIAGTPKMKSVCLQLQEKIGSEFVKREIYPIRAYNIPVDCR